jgi:hypothetical protein
MTDNMDDELCWEVALEVKPMKMKKKIHPSVMGQAQTQEYAQAAGRKFVVFLCN